MAITLGTLANAAAVAQTFTEISKDRTNAEWVNTTTVAPDNRLFIKQTPSIGKQASTGSPIRRFLVQLVQTAASAVGVAPEVCTMNFTCTAPQTLSALTEANLLDGVSELKNALIAVNFSALRRGEV